MSKNINFDKNETESKMEDSTYIFTETNLVLQLIKEWQIKSKTVMSWSSRKKIRAVFVLFILRKGFFLKLCFIAMYSVLNTLSEYTYFYISKNITSCTLLLLFKIVKSFECVLKLKYSQMVWIQNATQTKIKNKSYNMFP